jgi:hydroxyquinol 1,2-dioxygenase
MIVTGPDQVTEAVLHEMRNTPDPRVKEILTSLVRHLHGFARDVRLTEQEFERAIGYIVALGQRTTESHNEAVLMSGSLGFSTLICLLNNGMGGQTETAANLLGPFWRMDSPRTDSGASIVRSATPGEPIFVDVQVHDQAGRPIAGVEADVWHSSTEGLYENQDPSQAEMNLRGKFTTDAQGRFAFRSIKPAGYPVPVDGPVGELLRAQRRHNFRPAHLHVLLYRPGFKTLISQLYSPDDPHLETDAQFGVTRALIARYVRHEAAPAPAADVTGAWYSLAHTFVMEPGEARLPRPPITAKAQVQPAPTPALAG